MPQNKKNKGVGKLAQAKKLALKNEGRRKQLRALLKKAKAGEALSPKELEEAKTLVARINKSKEQIEDMGFDPKQAFAWAKSESKKGKKSRKISKFRSRRSRGSGVGTYGLGNSMRVWR
ncbi:hypothetical protein [Ruegeria arenilitoris]|uniref:hypothetical protein n=1 Tax=Ruegeria arenilitoris TaxID=1173585 RepID=UPI00147AB142|nr:hypothetical protein [Ruegeria arenilitoris]